VPSCVFVPLCACVMAARSCVRAFVRRRVICVSVCVCERVFSVYSCVRVFKEVCTYARLRALAIVCFVCVFAFVCVCV